MKTARLPIMQKTSLILLILIFSLNICGQKEQKEIFITDLTGNGKSDRIVEVLYQKPIFSISRTNNKKCENSNGYFAKYVLSYDNQNSGKTIFDYLIGDDEAQYWQHRIDKTVDLNKDGVKDLIFYAGDDTTHEFVFLIQKPNYFKAVYSGVLELDRFTDLNELNDVIANPNHSSPKILAKWNPKLEVFEGKKIQWVTENCVRLYARPNAKSELLQLLMRGWIFDTSVKKEDYQNGWQKIKMSSFDDSVESWVEIEGWIETRHLSKTSPTENFPIR